jgi:5-methylcytosine-specific restriction endonuclease McrA
MSEDFKSDKMISFGYQTLKLDATYRPIDVISGVEALVMCIVGKAKAIESYDAQIRSPNKSFKIPSVIVLQRVVKFRLTTPACSRKGVFQRDHNTCQYCTKKFTDKELTLDHILPKSRGGQNTGDNLVAACKKCNQKKGDRTPLESGMIPMTKPKVPKNNLVKITPYLKKIWKDYLWN